MLGVCGIFASSDIWKEISTIPADKKLDEIKLIIIGASMSEPQIAIFHHYLAYIVLYILDAVLTIAAGRMRNDFRATLFLSQPATVTTVMKDSQEGQPEHVHICTKDDSCVSAGMTIF